MVSKDALWKWITVPLEAANWSHVFGLYVVNLLVKIFISDIKSMIQAVVIFHSFKSQLSYQWIVEVVQVDIKMFQISMNLILL